MACVELLARMALKRILYISQEIFPYVEQSEIAKVSRELPEYMQHYDKNEVRLFMPRYGTINERRNQLHEVQRLSGINLTIDNRDHPLIVKVASIPSARIRFISFIMTTSSSVKLAWKYLRRARMIMTNAHYSLFRECLKPLRNCVGSRALFIAMVHLQLCLCFICARFITKMKRSILRNSL